MNQQKTVARLLPEVYEKFAKQFPQIHLTETTTALQVAEAIGKEKVLKALRDQLVIGNA